MGIPLTNNLAINITKATDDRYGKEVASVTVPFVSVAEAVAAIVVQRRHRGLVVMIDDGTGLKNFWWKDNLTDGALVLKDTGASAQNIETTITGVTWNFALGNYGNVLLAADRTITVANSVNTETGLLFVLQNNIGGFILTLAGQLPDDFNILLNPGALTVLAFVNRSGTIQWSMVAQYDVIPGEPVTPTAHTVAVVDDTANTLNWTNNPLFVALADSEQTLDGGTTIATLAAKPIVVGNIAKAIGQVGVRVKSVGANPPSAWVFNATAFTVATITPAAHTAAVVNDSTDTFDWTNNPLFVALADSEQTLDGGTTIATLAAKPIVVGNIAKAIGQVGVRVKSVGANPPSAWVFNATAFTVNNSANYNVSYDFESANITTEVSGPDTVVRTVDDLSNAVTTFNLITPNVAGAPKLIIGAVNGKNAIEIDATKNIAWNSVGAVTKPMTVIMVVKLLESRVFGYVQQSTSVSIGFNVLKPFIVGDSATALQSSIDITLNTWMVFVAELSNTTTSKIFINEALHITGNAGASLASWIIQLRDTGGNTAHYMLAEMDVKYALLSDSERTAEINRLKTKYAIV